MKNTILTILMIAAGLALGFAAACVSGPSAELVILHTNDLHSHIDPVRSGPDAGAGGVIERAAYIDSVRAADGCRNVLLVDAGDFSQGTSYFSILKGDVEVEVMNELGYDAVCLGNHEFDNGEDELLRRAKNAEFDILCANYDFSASELGQYVKPYTMVRKAGRKIGLIGILADVTRVVDKDIAERLKYLEPVETVNKYAALLREEGCGLVIVLSHLGFKDEPFTDPELASLISGVDIIIGGHSHTDLREKAVVKDRDGRDVVIVTDASLGVYVGKLTVD